MSHYLKENHIDYYLDEEGSYLQIASAEKNPYKITEAIKKGIKESTHMAVVISEKTYQSEWIPLEVGYGHAAIIDKAMIINRRNNSLHLAVIILKDIQDKLLHDYSKVGYQIKSIEEYIRYLNKIKGDQIFEINLAYEVRLHQITVNFDKNSLVNILLS